MDTSWIVTEIKVKDKTLVVFYDKCEYGLFSLFSSDSDIEKYIQNNLEEAFNKAIFKKKNAPYFLNIASVENLGRFKWEEYNKNFLNNLLNMYIPIIRKFTADALTNTLQISLDEEFTSQNWMKYTSY